MSHNGKIGLGWYEDYVTEAPDEFREKACVLLRDKLKEVFDIAQERQNEKISN